MTRKTFDALSYAMVDLFESDDHTESEVFHESTKLNHVNQSVVGRRVKSIVTSPELKLMMTRAYKTYSGCEKIALPETTLGSMSLEAAIRGRRSQLDRFAGGSISMAQLAALVRYSYGATAVREVSGKPDQRAFLRAAASAGGLYPLEVYPIVLDVEGCAPGIYHYSVTDNAFEVLAQRPMRDEILAADITSYRELIESCAAVIAISAVVPRTVSKYLFRGYRFILNDVGTLLQNLYLTGTALGLGTCAVGGFYDNDAGRFLDVDNVDEHVMMLFAVGQPLAGRDSVYAG